MFGKNNVILNVEKKSCSGKNRALDNWFYRQGTFCSNCNFTLQCVSSPQAVRSFILCHFFSAPRIPGFLLSLLCFLIVLQDPTNVLDCSPTWRGDTRSVFNLCQSSWKVSHWSHSPFSRPFFLPPAPHSRWLLEVIVWGSFKQSAAAPIGWEKF